MRISDWSSDVCSSDLARRQRRNPALFFSFQEESDAASPPQQEWNMEADDLLRLYEEAVDAMPPKTRRVFLMHRVDELSYREIHEFLGISIATVGFHMIDRKITRLYSIH